MKLWMLKVLGMLGYYKEMDAILNGY